MARYPYVLINGFDCAVQETNVFLLCTVKCDIELALIQDSEALSSEQVYTIC